MYYFRKNGNRVYVVYRDKGRLIALPRSETQHLDLLSDSAIRTFMERWLVVNRETQAIKNSFPIAPVPLQNIIDEFADYLSQAGRSKNTITQYRTYLLRAGGLLGWPLISWPEKSRSWVLLTSEQSPMVRQRLRICVLAFWKWCCAAGHAAGPLYVLRTGVKSNPTPLKKVITPDEVIGWEFRRPDLKLLSLLGYFFSLRPQEVIALKKTDFAAGSDVAQLECCRVMATSGLFDRFAVHIERQRLYAGETPRHPKSHSIGWVACFNREAALRIVELLKQRPEQLFTHGLDWYNELRRREGVEWEFKDLRRASLYHLGHHTNLNLVQLRNHARHRRVETTMLYTRRPDAEVKRGLDLDI